MIGIFFAGCGQLITPEPVLVATPNAVALPSPTLVPTVTARPTATPKPATPVPTPTPTMTPTPIIYTVQRGDNLLAIAIDHEISVEALQTANGILNPRSLQIGQVLVIPETRSGSELCPITLANPLPSVDSRA